MEKIKDKRKMTVRTGKVMKTVYFMQLAVKMAGLKNRLQEYVVEWDCNNHIHKIISDITATSHAKILSVLEKEGFKKSGARTGEISVYSGMIKNRKFVCLLENKFDQTDIKHVLTFIPVRA